MNQIKYIFILLSIFIISSCTSGRYVNFSNFSFPEEPLQITNNPLIIVNNAAEQPDKINSRLILKDGKINKVLSYQRDSVNNKMINVLGEKLNESGFYDDVLIYNDIIRTDSLYNELIPLNKTTIDTIFEVSGSEWILSLDKLNYHTILTDKNITQMFSPFISLHIIVEADFSIFEYGNYIPLQSLKIKDTINWETSHVMLENAINELADFNTCLYDAIYISAENGIKKWIPQIKTVERFVVKSNNSAMIEAYDFFICKEYENAVIMWEHVYETIPNNKLKQQAAYNIAIVNEKEMNFENALHWIELAKNINPEVSEIATVSLDNYEKYIKESIRRMQKYKSIK